jgi:hypothetical protein
MAEQVIKQIKTNDGKLHDIDAAYLNGKTYTDIQNEIDDIRDIAQGAIETYVIPTSKSTVSGYSTIVNSTSTTVSVSKTYLDNLTNGQANGGYKLGDVILMEATSDGTKVFDRWVSNVSGDVINLSVLETQVATHHHTINIGSTSGKALTGISASSRTAALTVVSTAVDVLTSAAGTFVTSVDYKDDGGYDLDISTGTSTDGSKAHSHSTVAHSHSFTPTSLVSQTVSAYTSLTSETRTLHSHTVVSAAGTPINDTAFNVATGASQTGTFLVNLKDSANQTTGTNTKGLETGGSGALSTSAQTSSDTIGSVVNTLIGGSHTHDVTTTTDTNVVTAATVAASVVTSVSYNFTKPTVAGNVIVGVEKVAKTTVTSAVLTGTTTFFNSATVDSSGILSFGTASVGIDAPRATISAVGTITSSIQSQGSLTMNAPRSSQSATSGTVTATGTATAAGAHSHGFSHTHSIPTHNHTIAAHTHTYVKTIASQTGSAITTLSLKSYTPHTHSTNVGAASIASNESSAINIVTGGSKTLVVQNLKSSSFSTGTASPNTNNTYLKITGEITFPGLECTPGSVATSSKSINPAATGTETALKSITFTSSNFVQTVTSGTAIKTSENKGGK